MWQRSQRFANIYAIVATDVLFTIFWLAAWAALVAWVRSGIAAGAAKLNKPTSEISCANGFADSGFGEAAKCSLANACVGFGVIIFLLWSGTAGIGVFWALKAHREPKKEGQETPWLPGGVARPAATVYGQVKERDEGGDGVWSSEMDVEQQHNIHDQAYDHDEYPLTDAAAVHGRSNSHDRLDRHDRHDLHDEDTADGRMHPGRRWDQPQPFEDDDEFDSGAPGSQRPPQLHHGGRQYSEEEDLPTYSAPTAPSPVGYYDSHDHDTSYGGAGGRPGGNTAPPNTYGYDR
jgi:hypothetical protein